MPVDIPCGITGRALPGQARGGKAGIAKLHRTAQGTLISAHVKKEDPSERTRVRPRRRIRQRTT